MKATTKITTKFQPIELNLVIESEQELDHLQNIFGRTVSIPNAIHPDDFYKQADLIQTMRKVWEAVRSL
jgi:hypothetical protein